ncbi:MAG TPA: hypothetical protein VG388_02650 [Solirubrobacteraceae bacterium]|nr:hypothetical protein [Solirubrobacteraceae bacterium]
MRPELAALAVADPPASPATLGFALAAGAMELGGVRVDLGVAGEGIVSWSLRGVEASDIDGLGESLGPVRDAVPPGRRIATLPPGAGLGPAVAFMDPEPA